MIFGKKKKEIECINCNSKISDGFSFCPHCGDSQFDEAKEKREFGFLGRDDVSKTSERDPINNSPFGITDKFINSMMNSMIKALDKQMKDGSEANFEGANVEHSPNGIKIRIGIPQGKKTRHHNHNHNHNHKQAKKQITEEQMGKLSSLPRAHAKTNMRRLSDKIVYELSAPGIKSPEDVFVSKLENGYEIKAIGKSKIYVNSLPVNLPLKGFSIANNKLLVEFKPEK